MKIIWMSAPAWNKTGYGVQSYNWVRRLIDHGHEVTFQSTGQLQNTAVLEWRGIRHLPLVNEAAIGADSLLGWMPIVQPDMVITLYDAWPYPPNFGDAVGCWYPMAPIDHDPIPPDVLERLKHCVRPIAYSKHAYELEKQAGLNPAYIPHGVDTRAFKPSEKMDLGGGKFVVGMVATNIDDRKAWSEQMQAFGKFHAIHPDSILYAHTNPLARSNFNLIKLAQACGLKQGDVLFADKAVINYGIEDEHMAQLYSSFDVLLSATAGEGFGVPILEAQSCGTPVIVNNWTAPRDLCGSGWRVDKVIKRWDNQNSWWGFPDIDELTDKLCLAYEHRGDQSLRDKARAFAETYDFDVLYDAYFSPFLKEEEKRIKGKTARKRHKRGSV